VDYIKQMAYSEKTLQTYNSCLNSIAKDLNFYCPIGFYPDGWQWLEDHTKIWNLVQVKSDSLHSRSTYLYAVRYLLDLRDAPKELDNEYKKYTYSLRYKIEESYMTKQKTKKQIENWVNMTELKLILKGLDDCVPKTIKNAQDYRNLIKYLLLLLHISVPLRRDLSECKIYKDPTPEELADKRFNYIVLTTSTGIASYIGNVFKSSKYYGEIIFDWNKSIAKELFYYYDSLVEFGCDHYFIVDSGKEPFSKCNYTRLLNSIFKPYNKRVSASLLRNIIISDLYNLDAEKQKKLEEFAKICGHSQKTQYCYYAKV
jgi:hypothetical protein